MSYSANMLILNKFNFLCFPLFCRFYALHAHEFTKEEFPQGFSSFSFL